MDDFTCQLNRAQKQFITQISIPQIAHESKNKAMLISLCLEAISTHHAHDESVKPILEKGINAIESLGTDLNHLELLQLDYWRSASEVDLRATSINCINYLNLQYDLKKVFEIDTEADCVLVNTHKGFVSFALIAILRAASMYRKSSDPVKISIGNLQPNNETSNSELKLRLGSEMKRVSAIWDCHFMSDSGFAGFTDQYAFEVPKPLQTPSRAFGLYDVFHWLHLSQSVSVEIWDCSHTGTRIRILFP